MQREPNVIGPLSKNGFECSDVSQIEEIKKTNKNHE